MYDEANPGDEDESAKAAPWGSDCPAGCTVCAGAKAEFDALAEKSKMHKKRLLEPEAHPYAAGKHTLHRSLCARVKEHLGTAGSDNRPFRRDDLSFRREDLREFAHHGYRNAGWAALMTVMTANEAVEWTRARVGPRGGTKYKLCHICQPECP